MFVPRKSYFGQLLGWTAAFVLSRLVFPVADTTVQDFWKDKAEPFLAAHALAWVSTVFDWLGSFWTGVVSTLFVTFVFEMLFAWRKSTKLEALTAQPHIDKSAQIELGTECVRIADEAFRQLQQADDSAPQIIRPSGADDAQWAQQVHANAMQLHAHQRRSLMQRDRAYGGEFVDTLFRLRDAGLTIPNFADRNAPALPDDVMAGMVKFYLSDYARFTKAMGLKLKRGELDAAVRASHTYRPTLEGPVPEPQAVVLPPIVKDVRFIRSHDVTSRWYAHFKMGLAANELMICLDLQYYTEGSDDNDGTWGGKVRHPIERWTNLVFGQTLHFLIVDDAPYMIEQDAPHWRAPLAFEQQGGLSPSMPSFCRGSLTFMANGEEQEHRFITLPRKPDQAMVIIGQESLSNDEFWSENYRPFYRYLAFGERETPHYS